MRRALLIAGVVLVVCAIGIAATFVHDLSQARARLTGRSQLIQTSFGQVEYATTGQGPAVLVVHGAGGGFDQALDMMGPLAADGYLVIAPSRFGYLRSRAPVDLTNAKQADALEQLLDRLGIEKANIIGISAGAWSALQFAVRHRDRCASLTLIVPAPPRPAQQDKGQLAFVRTMFGSDFITWATIRLLPILPASMTRMILGSDPRLVRTAAPSEQSRVQTILEHLLPVSERTDGMLFDIKSATTPEPVSIDRIACPVLTISARDDAFGTAARAQAIANEVPHGHAVIYASGGHALIGDYDRVRQDILGFLKNPNDLAH